MSHEQITINTNQSESKKYETSEESYRRLRRIVKDIVDEIRQELQNKFSQENGFVDGDGSIRMNNFYDSNVESQKEFAQKSQGDKEAVDLQERYWAGLDNEESKRNRTQAYHLPENADDKAILQAYRKHKETSLPNQLEMAITILLHKRFGDRYVVVRASKYDDYFNGIDNVLVNKETGDVICAFDEVRMNERSDRDAYKKERSRKKASQGGATLKYGFQITGGKIVKQPIASIPIFCLGLDSEDCNALINNISYANKTDNPTLKTQTLNETEKEILEKLLASIREQRDQLMQDEDVKKHGAVIENLTKVDSLLLN